MARAKPKTRLMVADGVGGMIQVADRRFERGEWPISFEVPTEQAEDWFRYVEYESDRRGWSGAGMSQLDPRENSGTQMLLADGAERISVAWDRTRGGILKVRAKPVTAALAEAQEFFRSVNERSGTRTTEPLFRWGALEYEGRAWRGELWLTDELRLGPPSVQYTQAVFGPRAVIVEAIVDSISQRHSSVVFGRILERLSAFLSVVTGIYFQPPQQGQAWTWEITPQGTACSVRTLGYIETAEHRGMPPLGTCSAVPLTPLIESEHERAERSITQQQQALPEDVVALWAKYQALTAEQQRQFFAAASKFQEALSHWGKRSTASFACMVVACEALKPSDSRYSEHNLYDVVEALLGDKAAERLRTQLFDQKVHPRVHPQTIRSAHFHRGEVYGAEFALDWMSDFRDPTFDGASRELFKATKDAMVEWLRRGGTFEMSVRNRKKTWRRWLRDYALQIALLALLTGVCVGWLLSLL